MKIKYCEPKYPILIRPHFENGENSSSPSDLEIQLKPMAEVLYRPSHQARSSKKHQGSTAPAIGSSLIKDIRETQKMIERLEAIILMNEASL